MDLAFKTIYEGIHGTTFYVYKAISALTENELAQTLMQPTHWLHRDNEVLFFSSRYHGETIEVLLDGGYAEVTIEINKQQ